MLTLKKGESYYHGSKYNNNLMFIVVSTITGDANGFRYGCRLEIEEEYSGD